MKKLLLIPIVVLLSCQMKAQGLTPSTVRQVFSLQGGDSLQYHIWTTAQVCQTICNVYKWYVIDTVFPATAGDSLTVWFHTAEIHMDSLDLIGAPCAPACYHEVEVDLPGSSSVRDFTLAYADSAIDSAASMWHYAVRQDSIVSDPGKYGGYKQHVINWNDNIMASGIDIFVDSLGITYHNVLGYEFSNAQNEELIYYHKSNSKTWGTRYVNTGINDIPGTGYISLYPNPAGSKFTLSVEQYQDASFELYDILGKKIMTLSLKEKETEVSSRSLPSGIYQWHIIKADQSIKTGKLVID